MLSTLFQGSSYLERVCLEMAYFLLLFLLPYMVNTIDCLNIDDVLFSDLWGRYATGRASRNGRAKLQVYSHFCYFKFQLSKFYSDTMHWYRCTIAFSYSIFTIWRLTGVCCVPQIKLLPIICNSILWLRIGNIWALMCFLTLENDLHSIDGVY